MPTLRTRMASGFKAFESVSRIAESEEVIDAVRVESVIGRAFASRLRMFLKNDWAVQSSGSVRTMPILASFLFRFWLYILGVL